MKTRTIFFVLLALVCVLISTAEASERKASYSVKKPLPFVVITTTKTDSGEVKTEYHGWVNHDSLATTLTATYTYGIWGGKPPSLPEMTMFERARNDGQLPTAFADVIRQDPKLAVLLRDVSIHNSPYDQHQQWEYSYPGYYSVSPVGQPRPIDAWNNNWYNYGKTNGGTLPPNKL